MTRYRPFSKVLIANRGEIAVRVMRSARAMGLATVAVYSDADAGAEHARLADQAVRIGGGAPADSYLRIDAIIAAARATGADAIHPGYGFLAENPDLAQGCDDAGIIFVGPDAAAIRAMGDKARAKALMVAAGVPCVPGYAGADQDDATLLHEARRIGFPVMIKAVAGGGGRGMRLALDEAAFTDHLRAARSEAKGAFGVDTVLLEKAIVTPRHVEVQILADSHGNAIHLCERDCSVQRRHQKLIEEAPSPAVSPDLRDRMGAASVAAVKAIGYVGAGTFEYLLAPDGQFHFIEMNTRLQVEHPVTEAVTGLDLVALQLRIAAGQALPLAQEDVTVSGHAIEVRLCAEDPQSGFMPQSGTLALWDPAPFVRVDHALRSGARVPPQYDSMIAKLVAHGPTRDEARRRALAGLEQTLAMGLRTNKAFLAACLAHPVFAAGQATTAFLAEHAADLTQDSANAEARAAMIAAGVLRAAPDQTLVHGYGAPLRLARGAAVYHPRVTVGRAGHVRVEMTGQDPIALRVLSVAAGRVRLMLEGTEHSAAILSGDGLVSIQFEGRSFDFIDLTYVAAVSTTAPGGDGLLRASMTGTVASVAVAPGDAVALGQALVVIEAMKMEHAQCSPVDGTASAVHVQPGQQVGAETVLVEIAANPA